MSGIGKILKKACLSEAKWRSYEIIPEELLLHHVSVTYKV